MFNRSIVCCYLYNITKHGYPPPAEGTRGYLEAMKALGFRSVELEGIRETNLMAMHEWRAETQQDLDELGLELPYYCAVLPGLSSADGDERKKNLGLLERGCETAQALGSRGLIDNAPLPPYVFPKDIPVVRHYDESVLLAASFPPELDWGRYWNDLVATYREACDIARDHGLTYQMHPCVGALSSTTDAFLYFYDAVGRDNLRFNFDTANQFFLKDNLALSLRRLAGHIDYIHVSDNRGVRMEHLVPGGGEIDWETFFETLEFIGFEGDFGVDVGGDESGIAVEAMDAAYVHSAQWLEERVGMQTMEAV